MNKNLIFTVLCIFIVISMMFTGCNEKQKEDINHDSALKDGKYIPPITLRTFAFVGPQVKFAEGESMENNIWTRLYESDLGIKIKYDFTSPDYMTFDMKVMGALASNNLPDIIPVYTTLFFRIADAGKLANLQEAYDKYLSPEVKEMMNMSNGRAIKTCTRNNALVALAAPPEEGSARLLWIRDDWIKKLNLSQPKNVDDVMSIARAFAAKDPDGNGENDTYGLATEKTLGSLVGFANSFHAYYQAWVDKGDGTLIRGETLPVWKTVLSKLNGLYNDGALDPEFISKDATELEKDYAAQRLGMVYGDTNSPDGGINKAVEANPKAEWKWYPLLSNDNEPALGQIPTRIGNFISINKNCPYPEALMLLANIHRKVTTGTDTKYAEYHHQGEVNTYWYPIITFYTPYKNDTAQEKVTKALETGDVTTLNAEERSYYDMAKTWVDSKDKMGWRMYSLFGPNGSFIAHKENLKNKLYYEDRGWGPETEAWKTNGPDLYNKCLEYFSRMIIGDISIEQGYKEWVDYFNDNGGAKATEEINAWWQEEGKEGFTK